MEDHLVLLAETHGIPLLERQHLETLRLCCKCVLLELSALVLIILRINLVLDLEVASEDEADVLKDLEVYLDQALVERENKQSRKHRRALLRRIIDDAQIANTRQLVLADAPQHLMLVGTRLGDWRKFVDEQVTILDGLNV